MRTIITIILLCIAFTSSAQNAFIHTAETGNISVDATFIDHPDLNNNPNAKLLITHVWNPGGEGGVLNQKRTGVFYSDGAQQWGIYNEDASSMMEGTSYNVYYTEGSEIYLHIADAANQGTFDDYTVLNHPDLNNNPDANIILTTYYNPNALRNDHNYGVWYDENDGRWIIYIEDLTSIPLDSAFFVGIGGGAGVSVKHTATAANVLLNYTVIDHPMLNGNPNAIFNITHNWGISGDTSNIILDKTMGVWYTGTNWAIYNEDQSNMPEDIEFDLFIFDETLNIKDEFINELNYFPNPVSETLTISAADTLKKISLFNLQGQLVLEQKLSDISKTIKMDVLPAGNYITKVEAETATQVIKLIKL